MITGIRESRSIRKAVAGLALVGGLTATSASPKTLHADKATLTTANQILEHFPKIPETIGTITKRDEVPGATHLLVNIREVHRDPEIQPKIEKILLFLFKFFPKKIYGDGVTPALAPKIAQDAANYKTDMELEQRLVTGTLSAQENRRFAVLSDRAIFLRHCAEIEANYAGEAMFRFACQGQATILPAEDARLVQQEENLVNEYNNAFKSKVSAIGTSTLNPSEKKKAIEELCAQMSHFTPEQERIHAAREFHIIQVVKKSPEPVALADMGATHRFTDHDTVSYLEITPSGFSLSAWQKQELAKNISLTLRSLGLQ